MISKDELYSSKIFFNAVLPLVKVIIDATPEVKEKLKGKKGVMQVSALDGNQKFATHFIIEENQVKVCKGVHEKPTVELEFSTIERFNGFFKGKSKKLPKIRGWYKIGILVPMMKALMKMATLLGLKDIPESKDDKELLVKLYFYLLSSGISQLNKAGHEKVAKWVKKSPDRVYAWRVDGREDLSAYIRIKAGNSKACRGEYRRAKPFFMMRFDSVESALGTLLEKDNLIDATINGRLVMDGAPEFGAELGEYMTLVGSYAK